jgi:hypothetical protein
MKKEWHNLSWLPEPPDDFAALCKAAKPGDVEALRRLTAFRLSEPQLNRLARLCATFPGTPLGFEPFRLGIIGNANSDFLGPALKSSALRHGVWLDTYAAGMGQMVTAVLDPQNGLYQFRPDAVLLALTWHVFPLFIPATPSNTSVAGLENLKAEIEVTKDTLKENGNITLIVQTVPQAPLSLFGNLDRRITGTVRRAIDDFNAWLLTTNVPVIDAANLAEIVGLAAWHDSGQWNWAKLPFSQNLIPLYADYIGRYIGAWRGRSRKCLVLDLDNTLWGGVIGDDGLEGIELGQGSPRGEAFLAVQQPCRCGREGLFWRCARRTTKEMLVSHSPSIPNRYSRRRISPFFKRIGAIRQAISKRLPTRSTSHRKHSCSLTTTRLSATWSDANCLR